MCRPAPARHTLPSTAPRAHWADTQGFSNALPAHLCIHTLLSSSVSAPTLQSIHTRMHPRNHAPSAYPPTRLCATVAPTPYQPAAPTPSPHHYTHKHTRAEEALDRDASGSFGLAETGEDDWQVAGSARAADGEDARHEEAHGVHQPCCHLVAAVEHARQDLQVEDKNKGAKDDTDLGEEYAPTVPINCRRAGATSAESGAAPSAHTNTTHTCGNKQGHGAPVARPQGAGAARPQPRSSLATARLD